MYVWCVCVWWCVTLCVCACVCDMRRVGSLIVIMIIIIIIIVLFFLACPWSAQKTVRSWASQTYVPHHLAGRSPPAPTV